MKECKISRLQNLCLHGGSCGRCIGCIGQRHPNPQTSDNANLEVFEVANVICYFGGSKRLTASKCINTRPFLAKTSDQARPRVLVLTLPANTQGCEYWTDYKDVIPVQGGWLLGQSPSLFLFILFETRTARRRLSLSARFSGNSPVLVPLSRPCLPPSLIQSTAYHST